MVREWANKWENRAKGYFKPDVPTSRDPRTNVYAPKDTIDWASNKISRLFGPLPYLPGTSVPFTWLSIGEEVWNTGRQLFRDEIRMDKRYRRTKDPYEKLDGLARYMVKDYDPGEVSAKRAYHIKRGLRVAGGVVASLGIVGINGLIAGHVPGYAEALPFNIGPFHLPLPGNGIDIGPIQGTLPDAVRDVYLANAALKTISVVREASENRHLVKRLARKRPGDVMRGQKSYEKKLDRAIKWLRFNKTDRELVREAINLVVVPELQKRQAVYAVTPVAEKAYMHKQAAIVEGWDYAYEHPGAGSAILRRMIRKTEAGQAFPRIGLPYLRPKMLRWRNYERSKGTHYDVYTERYGHTQGDADLLVNPRTRNRKTA